MCVSLWQHVYRYGVPPGFQSRLDASWCPVVVSLSKKLYSHCSCLFRALFNEDLVAWGTCPYCVGDVVELQVP